MVTTGFPSFCLQSRSWTSPEVFPGGGKVNLWAWISTSIQEQVGAVGEHPRDYVGHAGAHLVLDHSVRAFDKESDEFCVALFVPDKVEHVFYNLAAVVEPEPELLVVECKGDVLAGLFGVLVADKGEGTGPAPALRSGRRHRQLPGGV